MVETSVNSSPELPNIVTLIAERCKGSHFAAYLLQWENLIFSCIIITVITLIAYAASRKISLIPGRLQSFFELLVSGVDDFVRGISEEKVCYE